MANFEEAIVKILANEGGARFTQKDNDKGGATKYGISQRAYPQEDIRNLTEQRARTLYKRDYWDRIRGDEMQSQVIAEVLFDASVNLGVATSCKLAQSILKISPIDGIMGNATLNRLLTYNEREFILRYTLTRIAHYAKICNKDKSQTKFLLGWLNRTLNLIKNPHPIDGD